MNKVKEFKAGDRIVIKYGALIKFRRKKLYTSYKYLGYNRKDGNFYYDGAPKLKGKEGLILHYSPIHKSYKIKIGDKLYFMGWRSIKSVKNAEKV